MLRKCSFSHGPAAFGPFDGVFVCMDCAGLIGALAFQNPSTVWSIAGSEPMTVPPEIHDELLRVLGRKLSAGRALRDGSEDPVQWADLIAAYATRRLDHLAVRACALALKQGTTADADAALATLLTPPLLKVDGLDALRRLVHSMS
jgi:hypothetical protein